MFLHELATTPKGLLAAVSAEAWRPAKWRKEEEHLLRLFDLKKGRELMEFPVLWDSGGARICFSNDETRVFVGCYYAQGLGCYSLADGTEIWRRKELKGVQFLSPIPGCDLLFCGREEGSCPVLDGATGATSSLPRGAKYVYPSPFGGIALVDKRAKDRPLELHEPLGNKLAEIPCTGYGVRRVAFSTTLLLLDKANQPLKCFDLKSVQEQWSYPASEDIPQCTAITYNERLGSFLVVFSKPGAPADLLGLEPIAGMTTRLRTLQNGWGSFYGGGEFFVDEAGTCYSVTGDGRLHEKLFGSLKPESKPDPKMQQLRSIAERNQSAEEIRAYMQAGGFPKEEVELVLFLKSHIDRKGSAG